MITYELEKVLQESTLRIKRIDFQKLVERVVLTGDINLVDEDGWSLLMWVISYNDMDTAGKLLEENINSNITDPYGIDALKIAIRNRNICMIKLLNNYDISKNNIKDAIEFAKKNNANELIIAVLENKLKNIKSRVKK